MLQAPPDACWAGAGDRHAGIRSVMLSLQLKASKHTLQLDQASLQSSMLTLNARSQMLVLVLLFASAPYKTPMQDVAAAEPQACHAYPCCTLVPWQTLPGLVGTGACAVQSHEFVRRAAHQRSKSCTGNLMLQRIEPLVISKHAARQKSRRPPTSSCCSDGSGSTDR